MNIPEYLIDRTVNNILLKMNKDLHHKKVEIDEKINTHLITELTGVNVFITDEMIYNLANNHKIMVSVIDDSGIDEHELCGKYFRSDIDLYEGVDDELIEAIKEYFDLKYKIRDLSSSLNRIIFTLHDMKILYDVFSEETTELRDYLFTNDDEIYKHQLTRIESIINLYNH